MPKAHGRADVGFPVGDVRDPGSFAGLRKQAELLPVAPGHAPAAGPGVFTFPNSLLNPFTPVFLGFVALVWFSRNIGKPKEAPGTAQSTHSEPMQAE